MAGPKHVGAATTLASNWTSHCAQDLENTVGAWDMYGQEDSKRYPDMQNEFFERAAGSLASRTAMMRFLFLGVPPNTFLFMLSLLPLTPFLTYRALVFKPSM